MPFPGGILALQHAGRKRASLTPMSEEAIDYNEKKRFFKENVKCTIGLFHQMIPSHLGKLTGVLVIEARTEVSHDGIFVLVKGMSLPKKKKRVQRGQDGYSNRPVTAVKFNVVGHSGKRGEEDTTGAYTIQAGTESYPLELSLPKSIDDLPPPKITPEGRLVFRVQAYMFRGDKCFHVGETTILFQGYRNLCGDNLEESTKKITFEEQLQYKKNYLSRKKCVDIYFSMDTSGYLPEEIMDFHMVTRNPDKIPLESRVELVAKVWYQEQSTAGGFTGTSTEEQKMSKLKVNVVASTEKAAEGDPSKEMIWKGNMRVARNLTPSYRYDFMYSISYHLKVIVGVPGEKDARITVDHPIFIGTTRESEEEEVVSDDDDDEDVAVDGAEGGDSNSEVDSHSGAETPLLRGTLHTSRSMCTLLTWDEPLSPVEPRSRPRAGSISSVLTFESHGSGSTIPSIFRMPPSYSQLSSRRPTMETLPPGYDDLADYEEKPLQEEDAVTEPLLGTSDKDDEDAQ